MFVANIERVRTHGSLPAGVVGNVGLNVDEKFDRRKDHGVKKLDLRKEGTLGEMKKRGVLLDCELGTISWSLDIPRKKIGSPVFSRPAHGK